MARVSAAANRTARGAGGILRSDGVLNGALFVSPSVTCVQFQRRIQSCQLCCEVGFTFYGCFSGTAAIGSLDFIGE